MPEPLFDPLFDEAKCDVPFVPKIDFLFIEDCAILPAPPPIFDCPDIEIPRDPPPQKIPCPDIGITTRGSVTTGTDPCAKPSFTVTVTKSVQASCGSCQVDFDFDFSLDIPPPRVPCPVLGASAGLTVLAGAATCGAEPRATVTVTNTTRSVESCGSVPQCTFDFDFDFEIPIPPAPCPTVDANGSLRIVNAGATPAVTITVTNTTVSASSCGDNNACLLDFDFDFTIPVPCPDLTAAGSLTLLTGSSACHASPQVLITVTRQSLSSDSRNLCAFDFDFDFTIPIPPPPCPKFSGEARASLTGTNPGTPWQPCGTNPSLGVDVNITTAAAGDSCNPSCAVLFDFDFDLRLPAPEVPCPGLGANASASLTILPLIEYYTIFDSSSSSLSRSSSCQNDPGVDVAIVVTRQQTSDSCAPSCTFDFDFDFDFKIPTPPCPTMRGSGDGTVTILDDDGQPSLAVDVTVLENHQACGTVCQYDFIFDFDLRIPSGSGGGSTMHFQIKDVDCDTGEWLVEPTYYTDSCGDPPGRNAETGFYHVLPFCVSPFTADELAESGYGVATYSYNLTSCTRRWVALTHCAEQGC